MRPVRQFLILGRLIYIEDHIRGMVYSMLSSGAKWDRVVDGIDDSTGKITAIDKLFHNYDTKYILSGSSDFLY